LTALIQVLTSDAGGGSGRRRRDAEHEKNPFENSDANSNVPSNEVIFYKDLKMHKRAYAVATFGSKVTPVVEFDTDPSTNTRALKNAIART
jgi:hypothetical protein